MISGRHCGGQAPPSHTVLFGCPEPWGWESMRNMFWGTRFPNPFGACPTGRWACPTPKVELPLMSSFNNGGTLPMVGTNLTLGASVAVLHILGGLEISSVLSHCLTLR